MTKHSAFFDNLVDSRGERLEKAHCEIIKDVVRNAEMVKSSRRIEDSMRKSNDRIDTEIFMERIKVVLNSSKSYYFEDTPDREAKFTRNFKALSSKDPEASKESIFQQMMKDVTYDFIKKEKDDVLKEVVNKTMETQPTYQSDGVLTLGLFRLPSSCGRGGKSVASALPSQSNNFTISFQRVKKGRARVQVVEENEDDEEDDDEEEEDINDEFEYKMVCPPENCDHEVKLVEVAVTNFMKMNENERREYCEKIEKEKKSSQPETYGLFYCQDEDFGIICMGQRYKFVASKRFYPSMVYNDFVALANKWASDHDIFSKENDIVSSDDAEKENIGVRPKEKLGNSRKKRDRDEKVYIHIQVYSY